MASELTLVSRAVLQVTNPLTVVTREPLSQIWTLEATMPPAVTFRELEAVATAGSRSTTPRKGGGRPQNCGQVWRCDLCGPVQNENAGLLFKITKSDCDNRAVSPVQSPGRHGAPCDCSGHSLCCWPQLWPAELCCWPANLHLQKGCVLCHRCSSLNGTKFKSLRVCETGRTLAARATERCPFQPPRLSCEGSTSEGARKDAK